MNQLPSKRIAIVLLGSAILTACGGSGSANQLSNNAANVSEVPAPAPEANAATPASTSAFSADYMVGKWSAIDEDCSATLEFRKDGTVATPIGDAKWTVAGDSLSFDYGDGSKPTVSTIKVLSPDRIEITHASGTKGTERRC